MAEPDLNKIAKTADRNLRRALAILSAILVAIVSYAFLATQLGADAGGSIMWAFLLGLTTQVIWYSAQSDNRRAKAQNDKTLIVTTFAQDCITTGLVMVSLGALLAFANVVPIGVTLAASAAAPLAYATGKHIWKQVKA